MRVDYDYREEYALRNQLGSPVELALRMAFYYLREKAYIQTATQPQFGFFQPYVPFGRIIRQVATPFGAQRAEKLLSWLGRFDTRVTDVVFRNALLQRAPHLMQMLTGQEKEQLDIGILRFSPALKQYFRHAEQTLRQLTGRVTAFGQAKVARSVGLRLSTPIMYHIGKTLQQQELGSFYGFLGSLAIGLGTLVYRGVKNLGVRYKYLQYQRMVSSGARVLSTVEGRQTAEEQMYLQQQFAQLGNLTNEQQALRENAYSQYYFMGVNP